MKVCPIKRCGSVKVKRVMVEGKKHDQCGKCGFSRPEFPHLYEQNMGEPAGMRPVGPGSFMAYVAGSKHS